MQTYAMILKAAQERGASLERMARRIVAAL
jgi:hypothetical protein